MMIKLIFFLSLYFFSIICFGAEQALRMATTTSTENSGLLNQLNPVFEKKYKVRVDTIAVGTGKALKLAENGDVDLVFVHAPDAEQTFVERGFGIDRKAVMHNDFVLVGPSNDPANIKGSQSIAEALQKIKAKKALFISRGDESGTHKKEKGLWELINQQPDHTQLPWYLSVGQGMGAVLILTDEKQAYTLTDRGTYIAMQDKVELMIVQQGDEILSNPYHIMVVNPVVHPHINYDLARQYIDFITSEPGQTLINNYRIENQQLFFPDALLVK